MILRNWLCIIKGLLTRTVLVGLSGTDQPYGTNGVQIPWPYITQLEYGIHDMAASAGVITHGIVLGTGTTPATKDDYNLDTVITHGSGAGQLQFGACSISNVIDTGTSWRATVTREVTNVSGSSITVNEVGLTGMRGVARKYTMIERTVITPVVMAHLETYIYRYLIDLPYDPGTKWLCYALLSAFDGVARLVRVIGGTYVNVLGVFSVNGVYMNTEYPSTPTHNGGLLVGSGTTPMTSLDYILETLYDNTIISYGAVSDTDIIDDVGFSYFFITRAITELTGVDKDINEVGMIGYCSHASSPRFLLARQVLPGTEVLPAYDSLTVRILVTLTY